MNIHNLIPFILAFTLLSQANAVIRAQDSAPAEKAQLANIIQTGLQTGVFEFPAGDFQISEPIDVGKVVGLKFRGAGQVYQRERQATERQTTRLIWTGPPGESIFRGVVRHGVFQDIAFVNSTIHVDTEFGFGSGLCTFDRVSWIGPKAGIIFGSFGYNGNAADNVIRENQFVGCERPIELRNSQQVNFAIVDCRFYRTPCCVYLFGGGLVDIVRPYLTDVKTVYFLAGDGSKTGSGNGRFSATDVKYDAQSESRPTIVRDVSTYGKRVLATNGIHWPPGGGELVVTDRANWKVETAIIMSNELPR
jgi:hypothetical protein